MLMPCPPPPHPHPVSADSTTPSFHPPHGLSRVISQRNHQCLDPTGGGGVGGHLAARGLTLLDQKLPVVPKSRDWNDDVTQCEIRGFFFNLKST